ncbi:hypothetical protein IW262DRAFT_1458078 [Armillaria fumosa]|nr:hypothetical protein IW262DRAFT_1458078 [Armillaria fumosa]
MRNEMVKAFPVIQGNLTGKTVVVVGTNGGIGYEAARHFALMNPDRFVVEKLQGEIDVGTAELRLADLSSWKVILVMNAAAWPGKEYHAIADGWESSLQINNLGTFVLSLRLLPLRIDTSLEPRLVIVTSDVHYFAKVEEKIVAQPEIWKNLSSKEYCTPENIPPYQTYVDFDLPLLQVYLIALVLVLNMFFVRSLATRLPTSSPVISAIHPAVCISDLRREFTGIRKCTEPVLQKLIMYTAEEGSRQLVYGALGQDKNLLHDTLKGGGDQ